MQDEEDEPLPKLELTPFAQGLADRIMREGPMTLSEYMEKTVAHYYASRKPFGQEGDFVTSPDLTQMFGELIGAWIADLWMQMGRPHKAQLVELGPGRGTLSADILRAFKTWPDCAAAFSLHLVENSPSLREQQAKLLKAYKPKHYERLEQVPEKGPRFTIANEFLDALPIVSYARVKGKWHERLVSFNAQTGAFYFALAEKPSEPVVPKGYPKPMDRDVLELSPVSHEIIKTVCNSLNTSGGAALFVDYGELDPNFSDTLRSFRRHKMVDSERNAGGQDVTADVDFRSLCQTAAALAEVHGPVTQAAFLERLGINERCEALCAATPSADQRGKTRLALRRLTSSTDMGARFKVMGFTPKGSKLAPGGFSDAEE
jgi:SAM-dependent MidA family methyltransferase